MSELAELFEKDPLQMTKEDIALIVKRMRENRAQFELGLKAPVGERKTPKTRKSPADLLKDLGL